MGGADDVIGQRAVEQDAGLALDEGLELRLPLFGPAETGRGQQGEQLFRAGGAAQELVEAAVGRDAVAAFTGQDERAARLEDARAGAHALDALIQVLIERIAAVGGDDDVKGRVELLHRRLPDEFAAGLVGREQVAGEDAGDLPLLVQGHVEQEARAGAQGDVAHFLPDGDCLG